MLKNKILNNSLIKELIADSNTLAIYVGGSRLLNLELSESDYDIIVVSKNKAIQSLFGAQIDEFESNKVHLQTVYFYNILKAFDSPYENMKSTEALCLLQFIWPDLDYIYKSKEYIGLQNIFKKYYSKVSLLSLENLLDSLTKPQINKSYLKSNYHYVCFNYILSNLLLTGNLYLTSEQKDILRLIKCIRKVPINVLSTLSNSTSRYHLFYYDYYRKIYQEVIACQKQFI